jgi:hypothetical protein
MKKRATAALILFLCLLAGPNAQAGNILLTVDDLAPSGNASISGGVLQLTTTANNQLGSAFGGPVPITNFSADFVFQYTGTIQSAGSADGLVFVIQNPASVNTGTPTGGSLGYAGIPQSVGVEFDNWTNPEYNDPLYAGQQYYGPNHIGIDVNGSVNSISVLNLSAATNGAADFNNGNTVFPRTWHAWVDYNGSTLSVSANTSGVKPSTPQLSQVIDLGKVIGSTAGVVGFTGSTGWAGQTEKVLSFQFDPPGAVPEPSTVALLGVGGALASGYARMNRKKQSSEEA